MDPWRKLAGASREDIRRLQDNKLRSFINTYLYPFSPHYRRVFDQHKINPKKIRTVDDLKYIPFTSKTDFLSPDQKSEPFRDFILQPDKDRIRSSWPATRLLALAVSRALHGASYVEDRFHQEFRPVFMTFTTGTTHTPVPFVYSNYDIQNLHISGDRMLKLFDIKNSERIVNMFPYAPHLAFWQVVFGGFASCTLILSTGGGKVMGTEGNIATLLKMKPSVLLGVPSYVYHVARVAKEKGCRMDFLKKVVLGASKIPQAFKLRLAELLASMGAKDVSIFGTYGFTEARAAWAECPTGLDVSSGYHLYPDKEIFEVVDPQTGEVKGEGEDGELVYTALDARASAVIRYRTGDFVKGGLTHESCPYCQRTVPRISSDITRLSNVKDLNLSKIKGALVNLNHFYTVLSEMPSVDEWQIEIGKKNNDPFEVDELNVYIAARNGSNLGKVEEDIKKQMLLTTEVTPNAVHFLPMPEMVKRLEVETANKEKRIVDCRPKE